MEILTPLRAIRAKCLDCCCGQFLEVRNCKIKDCSLWPYRMGHRPGEEVREALSGKGVLEAP